MADEGYVLVLAFDTDDPAFARGFEVGKVWAGLGEGERHFTVHQNSAEMVLRMAEAKGLTVRSTPVDDNYIDVEYA